MATIADVSGRTIAELISLSGRTAVVTGGGRGLGKAIALRLAEAGARVLIGDIDANTAIAAAEQINARHPDRALGIFMDVTDTASVKAAADGAIDRFGGLDIWINNAGIFPSIPIAEMTDDTWDHVFDINVRGVFSGSREAARRMIAANHGGVIVNVVSTAGFKGVAPGLAAYVGSKHAVRGIIRQMALELAPSSIRVLGVAPTYCVTEGNSIALSGNTDRVNSAQQIPAMLTSRLGRTGVPDDVARVVLFCASDLSNFMTGSTLLVDAGEVL